MIKKIFVPIDTTAIALAPIILQICKAKTPKPPEKQTPDVQERVDNNLFNGFSSYSAQGKLKNSFTFKFDNLSTSKVVEFKIETDAPATIIPGTLSAAGDPLHKLPTNVALLWI